MNGIPLKLKRYLGPFMNGIPLGMQYSVGKHMLTKKLRGVKRFPLVLMLEPLHACNFRCAGCGRIREYRDTIHRQMTLEECLESIDEADAPVVSVCGGEPLIYPQIGALVREIQRRRKYVYLCTNAWILERNLGRFVPDKYLILSVHLDGMKKTHDAMVEKPGSFDTCINAIRAAKEKGFWVCTNTTIYSSTEPDEIVELYKLLQEMGVDGFLISPAYTYSMIDRNCFLGQNGTEKFRKLLPRLKPFKIWHSPVFLKFLQGEVELKCSAWANPTRNPAGWRSPCYQIMDKHYGTFREMIEETDWEYWAGRKDERCKTCMTHCGYEPSAALSMVPGLPFLPFFNHRSPKSPLKPLPQSEKGKKGKPGTNIWIQR